MPSSRSSRDRAPTCACAQRSPASSCRRISFRFQVTLGIEEFVTAITEEDVQVAPDIVAEAGTLEQLG